MRILISNITDKRASALAQYEVGNLFTAPRHRTPFLPYYALDNGAFSCFLHQKEFDSDSFLFFLRQWYNKNSTKPKWLVVPDVVGDPEGICYAARTLTIKNYIQWEKRLRKYKTPLAFAVQDGLTLTRPKVRGFLRN